MNHVQPVIEGGKGCKDDARQSDWLPGKYTPERCAQACNSMTPPESEDSYDWSFIDEKTQLGKYIFFEVSSEEQCKCMELCQAASYGDNKAYLIGEDRIKVGEFLWEMCVPECKGRKTPEDRDSCARECTLGGGGHHDLLQKGDASFFR